MGATQSELRLANRIDERELVRGKHEAKLAEIEAREDKSLTPSDREQLTALREKAAELDVEITDLTSAIQADRDAIETAKTVRRVMAGTDSGVDMDDDGVVYRDFYTYARDMILTSQGREASKIQAQVGQDEVQRARERLQMLKRTPANTLSSNVSGLIPEQHIAQIFQVINKSRPLVASATRVGLERGTLSFPKITQRPVVAAQSAEKTEAGNTGMIVGMESATATTYLGGGDLSWQAINWSTPDALQLWFDLTAADYALKTEQDAGEVVQTAAFLNNIASTLGATPSYADFMTAIGAGLAEVYANSGDMADTIYLAPDRAAYLMGLTSTAMSPFANGRLSFRDGSGELVGLDAVISRGLDAGVIAVGVRSKLIVAETPGAPVELRVTEPAIGGVEVGLIGAFEAVVAEDEAFALLTTAS